MNNSNKNGSCLGGGDFNADFFLPAEYCSHFINILEKKEKPSAAAEAIWRD